MKNYRVALILLVACTFWQPPDAKILGKSSSSAAVLRKHLGIARITVGSSTLDDVLRELGPASVQRDLMHEESPAVICYIEFGSGEEPATVFHFIAGSAGGWKTINVARIEQSQDTKAPQNCAALARHIAASTNAGLRIGMSPADVTRLLGKRTALQNDTWEYRLSTRRAGVDTVYGIDVTFAARRVVAIEVHKTDTT